MDVVYAKTTTTVLSPRGFQVFVVLGQHWPVNDPIVKAYPDMFSDDPTYGLKFSEHPVAEPVKLSDPPKVEAATANPGEKRTVNRK